MKVEIMGLIPILGKKYVKTILLALNKHGIMNYGTLKKITKCPDGTLTNRLNELEKAGLVKTYEEESQYRLPQRMCEITELGRKALILYELDEKVCSLKKGQTLTCQIITGDNSITSNIKLFNKH
jgi:DNA-binding HxlR family transcriptional regulator